MACGGEDLKTFLESVGKNATCMYTSRIAVTEFIEDMGRRVFAQAPTSSTVL